MLRFMRKRFAGSYSALRGQPLVVRPVACLDEPPSSPRPGSSGTGRRSRSLHRSPELSSQAIASSFCAGSVQLASPVTRKGVAARVGGLGLADLAHGPAVMPDRDIRERVGRRSARRRCRPSPPESARRGRATSSSEVASPGRGRRNRSAGRRCQGPLRSISGSASSRSGWTTGSVLDGSRAQRRR